MEHAFVLMDQASSADQQVNAVKLLTHLSEDDAACLWVLVVTSASDVLVARLGQRLAEQGEAGMLHALLVAVQVAQRWDCLEKLCMAVLGPLLEQLKKTPKRGQCIPVVRSVVLGFQHSNALLRPTCNAISSLLKDDTLQKDDRDALVLLGHCLLHMFPGHDVGDLRIALQRTSPPSNAVLVASVRQYNWLRLENSEKEQAHDEKTSSPTSQSSMQVTKQPVVFERPPWIEGPYTSLRGAMQWSVKSTCSGRCIRGVFVPSRPPYMPVEPGQDLLCQWNRGEYYLGSVREIVQGQAVFRCAKGSDVVPTHELYYDIPMREDLPIGSRVFARVLKTPYFEGGLLMKRLPKDRFLVELDRGGASLSLPAKSLRVCQPVLVRASTGFDMGSVKGIVHRVAAIGGCVSLTGSWAPVTSRDPAPLDLAVTHPQATVMTGRCGTRALIGVQHRVEEQFTVSGSNDKEVTAAQMPYFDGQGTSLEVIGGERVLNFAGVQPYTVEAWIWIDKAEDEDSADAPKVDDEKKKQQQQGADASKKKNMFIVAKENQTSVGGNSKKSSKGKELGELLLGVTSDNRLFLQAPHLSSPHPLPLRTWVHVAGVSDGREGKLFVNGTQVAKSELQLVPRPDWYTPVTIGCNAESGNRLNFFQGYICEVRLWHVARTEAQLARTLELPLCGPYRGLRAYWPLCSTQKLLEDRGPLQLHANAVWGSSPRVVRRVGLSVTGALSHAVEWKPLDRSAVGHPMRLQHHSEVLGCLCSGTVEPSADPECAFDIQADSYGGSLIRSVRVGDVEDSWKCGTQLRHVAPGVTIGVSVQAGPIWDCAPVPLHSSSSAFVVNIGVQEDGWRCSIQAPVRCGPRRTVATARVASPEPDSSDTWELAVEYARGAVSVIVNSTVVLTCAHDMRPMLGLDHASAFFGLSVYNTGWLATAERGEVVQSTVSVLSWHAAGAATNIDEEKKQDKEAAPQGVAVTEASIRWLPTRCLLLVLLEIEAFMCIESHRRSWKRERALWLRSVVEECTRSLPPYAQTSSAVFFETVGIHLIRFAQGVDMSSQEWPYEDRDVWEASVCSVGTAGQLVDVLHDLLIRFEDCFPSAWKSKRGDVVSSLRRIQAWDDEVRRTGAAKELAEAVRKQLTFATNTKDKTLATAMANNAVTTGLCISALRSSKNSFKEALASLKSKEQLIELRQRDQLFFAITKNQWVPPGRKQKMYHYNGLAAGVMEKEWETSHGILHLTDVGPFEGYVAASSFGKKAGWVVGLLTDELDNTTWTFTGRSEESPGDLELCELEFDTKERDFRGHYYGRSRSGYWKGSRVSNFDQRRMTGLSGLHNLGNSCYQNSFLQSLFMTTGFRSGLLSQKLPLPPLEDADEKDKEKSKGPEDPILAAVRAAQSALKLLPESTVITQQLQRVFAFLALSQRPSIDQRPLKTILGDPVFRQKQSQDTMQYGRYILDQLSQGLANSNLQDVPRSIFGGSLKYVNVCEVCNTQKSTTEPFLDLCVSMPKRRGPITDLVVISDDTSDIAAPDDYERINTNLNAGRKKCPYVYVCVKRDAHGVVAPITNIVAQKWVGDEKRPDPPAGYDAIPGDVNPGSKNHVGLCIQRHPTASPITQISVGTNTTPNGFDRAGINLNAGAGSHPVYICVRRDLPVRAVSVVTASSLAQARLRCPDGFTLIEVNINLLTASDDGALQSVQEEKNADDTETDTDGDGSDTDDASQVLSVKGGSDVEPSDSHVYLAYTSGGKGAPLTSIDLLAEKDLTASQRAEVTASGSGDSSNLVRLNSEYYLQCLRGSGSPIMQVSVYRAPRHPPAYGGDAQIDLCPGVSMNNGLFERPYHFLDGDKPFRLVFNEQQSSQEFDCYEMTAECKLYNGRVTGVLLPDPSRLSKSSGDSSSPTTWMFVGSWRKRGLSQPQPVTWLFDEDFSSFTGGWNNGSKEFAWSGQVDADAEDDKGQQGTRGPITDVCVIHNGREPVPSGYRMIKNTFGGHVANLNFKAGGSAPDIRICVKHADLSAEDPSTITPVTHVGLLWGGIGMAPNDYEVLTETPSGLSGNLNEGTQQHTLFLALRRGKQGQDSGLLNIGIWYMKEKIPAGFERLNQSFIGLEANLNPGARGHDMLLCYRHGTIKSVEEQKKDIHPVERRFKTDNAGSLLPSITRKCRGRWVSAGLVSRSSGAKRRIINGHMRGVLVDRPANPKAAGASGALPKRDGYRLIGAYNFTGNWKLDGSVDLMLDKGLTEVQGSCVHARQVSKWHGYKDCFVTLGYTNDPLSYWQGGRELFSATVFSNKCSDLLQQHFSAEALQGRFCDTCGTKTNTHRYTCMAQAPSHLLLNVKRFTFDYGSYKFDKVLDNIELEKTLRLPLPPPHLEWTGSAKELATLRGNEFALYAIVVHSGLRIAGGHYYTFARESGTDLAKDDPGLSPWYRLDDMKVTPITWEEIEAQLKKQLSATPYVLFYRRIDRAGAAADDAKSAEDADDTPAPRGNDVIPTDVLDPVMADNQRFVLREMSALTSPYYLQRLHALARSRAMLTQPFEVPQ